MFGLLRPRDEEGDPKGYIAALMTQCPSLGASTVVS